MGKYDKPRQTYSAKNCKCSVCGNDIRKGNECIVYPKTKTAKHIKCYAQESKQSEIQST
jgi:hypothetical protein